MSTGRAPALRRRRAQRKTAIDAARTLADGVRSRPSVRGVAVFGSFARGDFHDASDVDVLVILDEALPVRPQERLDLVAPRPPGVHPVVWSPEELVERRRRQDPIAVESLERGVWVLGTPDEACQVRAEGDAPPP